MDVFIIFQLSANGFWVRTKEGKQQHYNKLKQIRYFNVINIDIADDAKSAVLCVLLRVRPLVKVEVRNFSLLRFPRWFCLIHDQLGMSLRRVKRLVIFKCQYFCLFHTQQCQFYLKYYFLRYY